MPYCPFIESQISVTHRGEQMKFFGHQVADDYLQGTLFELSVFVLLGIPSSDPIDLYVRSRRFPVILPMIAGHPGRQPCRQSALPSVRVV
jgi:hypothetical protein